MNYLQVTPSIKTRMPVTEEQVLSELGRATINLASVGEDTLRQRIRELQALQSILQDAEQNFYSECGITNINELNERVRNECKGLLAFSASSFTQEMNELGLYDEASIPLNEALEALLNSKEANDDLKELLETDALTLGEHEANVIIENFSASLQKTGYLTGRGKPASFSKSGQRRENNTQIGLKGLLLQTGKDFIKLENNKWVVDKKINDKATITPGLRKKLLIASGKANVEVEEANGALKMRIVYPIREQNRKVYAGWRYTSADLEKMTDKEKESIMLRIKRLCGKLIRNAGGTEKECRAFFRQLDKIGVKNLIKSNISGISGILGEAQAMAILEILTGNPDVKYVGDIQRQIVDSNGDKKNKGEIAIDIILKEYGFQVKNYNEFAYGMEKGIVISRKNKLSTWEEKLDINGTLKNVLDTIYGLQHFNIEYHPDYHDTAEALSNWEHFYMPKFFEGYGDKILQLDPSSDKRFSAEILGKELGGRKYNTFFFVSGKGYVPSSEIIQKIIDFFKDAFKNEADVTTHSSYSGRTIKDTLANDEGKQGKKGRNKVPSLETVQKGISLQLSMSLKLEKYLKI